MTRSSRKFELARRRTRAVRSSIPTTGMAGVFLIFCLVVGCGAGAEPLTQQSSDLVEESGQETLDQETLDQGTFDQGTFDQERVAQEVRARFEGLAVAARSLDLDAYLGFFDRSTFSALNADGSVVASLEPFADAYGASLKSMERYLTLDFTNVHVQAVSADVAVLVNEYVAEVKLTNGEIVRAAGGGTQVWSKRSGKWLLVNVSSSAAS